jgi:hypothetical protein
LRQEVTIKSVLVETGEDSQAQIDRAFASAFFLWVRGKWRRSAAQPVGLS